MSHVYDKTLPPSNFLRTPLLAARSLNLSGPSKNQTNWHYLPEVCKDWIMDFLDPDSGCFQQDQELGFLSCSQNRIGFGFCVYWKNFANCLLDLYLPGIKQESDCLNLVTVSSRSKLDLDSKFAKQDWIRAQTNQSMNTSTTNTFLIHFCLPLFIHG